MKPGHSIWYLTLVLSVILSVLTFPSDRTVTSQSRERRVSSDQSNSTNDPARSKFPAEIVKVDVDLVTIDALVLEKKTARIVGGLRKDNFQIYEDGAKQE